MAGLPVLVAELMKRETVGGPDGLSTCHRSKGCAIDSAKKETSGEAAVALWFRKREGGMGEQEGPTLVHMHQSWWCISSSNQLEDAAVRRFQILSTRSVKKPLGHQVG